MRASVLREGRMVYRDDVPDPVPGPGQVLVAVRSCGICGSDLHFAAHGAEIALPRADFRDRCLSTGCVVHRHPHPETVCPPVEQAVTTALLGPLSL